MLPAASDQVDFFLLVATILSVRFVFLERIKLNQLCVSLEFPNSIF